MDYQNNSGTAVGQAGQAQGQSGATVSPQQGQEVLPQGQGQRMISLDEAKQMAEAAAEAAFRKAQGYTDKNLQRVQARLNEVEAAYKLVRGSGLSDQEREQVQAKLLAELPAEGASAAAAVPVQDAGRQAQAQPAQPAQQDLTEWANAQAEAIFKAAGVEVEGDDPEAKLVDMTSPQSFVETLKTATAAKQARVRQAAGARIPTLLAGGMRANPIQDINDPMELIKMGLGGKP